MDSQISNQFPQADARLETGSDEKLGSILRDKIKYSASRFAPLRIALSPPELQVLKREMRGEPTNATYVIQAYIAKGLLSRGHQLSYIGPVDPDQVIFTPDLEKSLGAPRTWSNSRLFVYSEKAAWSFQRALGIPYLNVFSNFRLFDAGLRCLPGHDIVYERNGLYKFGLAMACKRLRIPYVLYFEADDIMESDVMDQPIQGLLRWRARDSIRCNLRAADCIVAVTDAGKDILIEGWGVRPEKIVVFPNVADVERFRPDPESRKQTRDKLGTGDRPLVVFVGNFYQWHDVATLLDAFSTLTEEHPEARLVLVGDGDRRAAMEAYAAELGLGQSVQFTGLVAHSDVPNILAAADMAVVPYPPMDNDLWLSPLKLFEYMASGTAIVASDIGQITEIIDDQRNGLLVPPGDAAAMAGALKQLIDGRGLRARLGEAAREDAVRKHSWEHYITRLEQVFAAVIAGESFQDI